LTLEDETNHSQPELAAPENPAELAAGSGSNKMPWKITFPPDHEQPVPVGWAEGVQSIE